MRFEYLAVILFIHSCLAQNNIIKTSNMKNINIVEFNSHQINGEYIRKMDDGTVVIQVGDSSGYTERQIPESGWFYSYKEFYGSGELKTEGKLFKKGEFQSGIWSQYDESGKLISTTNYDEPYKLTIDSVLEIGRAHV